MIQLTEEQSERLRQIREQHQQRIEQNRDDTDSHFDIDFLLSLLDSDSQTAHDPFPPVTDTGRGRCRHNVPTCGECQIGEVLAHVKDKEQAASDAATRMRDKCVEKVKARRSEKQIEAEARRDPDNPLDYRGSYGLAVGAVDVCDDILADISSLTLEPEKQK